MKIPLYLKACFSPFKRPKLHFYFGKTAVGVPYFLPRKWVKHENKEGYLKGIPLKIGFSHCGIGWKTKYEQYRFEYSPCWSFVAFGYQLAVTLIAPHCDQYWESFLYYYYDTDKSKSAEERIQQCIKEYPQIWTQHRADNEETVDYYKLILKEKYK